MERKTNQPRKELLCSKLRKRHIGDRVSRSPENIGAIHWVVAGGLGEDCILLPLKLDSRCGAVVNLIRPICDAKRTGTEVGSRQEGILACAHTAMRLNRTVDHK